MHSNTRFFGLRSPFTRAAGILATALFLSFPASAAAPSGSAKSSNPSLPAASASVDLDGTLEVQIEDDFKGNKSRTRHFLNTEAGERYELQFRSGESHHRTGTRVHVKGEKSGDLVTLDTGSSSVQVVTEAAATNTFGTQNTLVMLVNFQDQPTSQPWTLSQVNSFMFGPVSDFFTENSYRQTSLAGKVVGWYTIPVSSTTCDGNTIGTYAKQAASAAGVNLAAYTRYVYLFPRTSACAWAGMGTVGGNPSQAWINGYFELSVVAHELGHNFGLSHSHSWSCTDASIIGTSSACSAVEYGDGVDIMGAGGSSWSNTTGAHVHAFQKERLGWLNNGVLPPITTVSSSGTYTIDPYETTGAAPKALKILKSGPDAYGFKTWYYVEYRQPVGFDAILGTNGNTMNGTNIFGGLVVHTAYEGNGGNSSYLLDMTPATYTLYTKDPALGVGQSFTDAAAGLTITTAWANSTNAGLQVTLASAPATCTHANPSVLMSPSQSASVAAGTPVTYTVALTNNDSSACSAASFNLLASVPSGWSAALGAASLSVAPGSAASTTLKVTSPTSASAGSYSVGTTATNSASTSYKGSGSASYSIGAAAASLSTTVATDKASYAPGATVSMTASVTNGGTPVANASVTFTVTKPNGTVVSQSATTGSTGQAVYKLRLNKQKDPVGTYQAKDVATTSGGSSATAATSFTVQ